MRVIVVRVIVVRVVVVRVVVVRVYFYESGCCESGISIEQKSLKKWCPKQTIFDEGIYLTFF